MSESVRSAQQSGFGDEIMEQDEEMKEEDGATE